MAFYNANNILKISDEEVQKLMQETPENIRNKMMLDAEFFSKDAISNAERLKVLKTNFSN